MAAMLYSPVYRIVLTIGKSVSLRVLGQLLVTVVGFYGAFLKKRHCHYRLNTDSVIPGSSGMNYRMKRRCPDGSQFKICLHQGQRKCHRN